MWLRGLEELARGVTQLVFPNECLICAVPEHDRHDFRHGLCSDCRSAVTADPVPSCPRCALTIGPHTDVTRGCGSCRGETLGFDSAIRLGPYEGRLREALLRMKSWHGEPLAENLGRLFCETLNSRLRALEVDLVVPVPLHWRRRWARGYNQAAALAREIAVGLEKKLVPGLLKRIRHTPQQLQPSASARKENVLGAFRVNRVASLVGSSVLLVDDVLTTGNTAGEASRMLREAGAIRVTVAVLARR